MPRSGAISLSWSALSGGVSRRVPYIERPNINSQASTPLYSSGQVQEALLFLQSKKVDVPLYIKSRSSCKN